MRKVGTLVIQTISLIWCQYQCCGQRGPDNRGWYCIGSEVYNDVNASDAIMHSYLERFYYYYYYYNIVGMVLKCRFRLATYFFSTGPTVDSLMICYTSMPTNIV